MPFERVVDGLMRYIDREILSNMNDWQEIVARIVVGRISTNSLAIKQYMINNGFIRTLGIIDSDGVVDVEHLLLDLRTEIERKGSLQIDVPMVGKLCFKPADIDMLKNDIGWR